MEGRHTQAERSTDKSSPAILFDAAQLESVRVRLGVASPGRGGCSFHDRWQSGSVLARAKAVSSGAVVSPVESRIQK